MKQTEGLYTLAYTALLVAPPRKCFRFKTAIARIVHFRGSFSTWHELFLTKIHELQVGKDGSQKYDFALF